MALFDALCDICRASCVHLARAISLNLVSMRSQNLTDHGMFFYNKRPAISLTLACGNHAGSRRGLRNLLEGTKATFA